MLIANCKMCGKQVQRHRSTVDRSKSGEFTCSLACRRVWLSKYMTGRPYTGASKKGIIRKEIGIRFWEKVNKSSGYIASNMSTECWEWIGGRTARGYGVIADIDKPSGKVYAHRMSYELEYGEIPDGLQVCHDCDNPKCIRPDHLFLGTAKDNAVNSAKKGRRNRIRIADKYSDNQKAELLERLFRWDGSSEDFLVAEKLSIHGIREILGTTALDEASKKRTERKYARIAERYATCMYSMKELSVEFDCDIAIIHRAVSRFLTQEEREAIKDSHWRGKRPA